MAITVLTTDNIKLYNIKSLVYGPSGVGKTRLTITCPDTFVFSAEDGLLSLREHKVPYAEVKSYKQLVEAISWLSSSEAKKYHHVMLDSLSEIAEVVLGEEKKKSKDGRAAYGAMQDTMYEIMRYIRDFKGKHITMIGKQISVQEGLSKKCVPIMPSEKLLAQVPYFWDEVLHMHIGTTPDGLTSYRAFHTQDNAQWSAKDRSGRLAEIEEPHMGKLFAKILA